MSLLLQLNGDLPAHFPDDERRLHIFCCRKKTCSRKNGSVRAIREVKKHISEKAQRPDASENKLKDEEYHPPPDLGTILFGAVVTSSNSSTANPFSTSNPGSTVNPFASLGPTSNLAAKPPQRPEDNSEPPSETFAQKLKISSQDAVPNVKSKSEPWPSESTFPSPFPIHDLESDFELLYPDSPTKLEPSPSKTQYDTEDSNANGTEKDLFESDVDKTFLKFSDHLSHNPEQVLRYEFNGTPLLYSGNDAVASRFVVPHGRTGPVQGIPRCEICGAKRTFECQLVPGAISILEENEELVDLESGMEWGTIILGVCTNDCGVVGEVAFREEWVGIQWEERLAQK
jgi:pre-rRNA-processing protein TSR4